ncbi:MAG: FMN-binding negative transcriptional regulator, partial [Moraxellaceae bacterium]
PEDFVQKLITAIVGIEIPISKLVGKWKVSQNQPERNQVSVVDGLVETHDASDMARLMNSHLKI